MRILQLNVWTGRVKGALINFLRYNDFDVICMQEAVWAEKDNDRLQNLFATVEQIKKASGLKYELRSSNWYMNVFSDGDKMEQGNVILSRFKIVDEQSKLVYGKYGAVNSRQDFYDHAYTLQMAKLENGVTIFNHHGYWRPNPIGDKTTIKVMRKVGEIVREAKGPVIVCGDFNIIHDSPAMRELDFLEDLTEKYGVKTTLTSLKLKKKVACDHILVNNEVKVKDFKVLDNLVSDHTPLVAEVEV